MCLVVIDVLFNTIIQLFILYQKLLKHPLVLYKLHHFLMWCAMVSYAILVAVFVPLSFLDPCCISGSILFDSKNSLNLWLIIFPVFSQSPLVVTSVCNGCYGLFFVWVLIWIMLFILIWKVAHGSYMVIHFL